MRRALILQHLAFEDAGSLAPALRDAGFTLDVQDACTADLRALAHEEPDLLVVLGGPIGVYEQTQYPFLVDELDWLRARLAAGLPTLGICLGAQLMAAALGARVYPGMAGKELGWAPLQAGRDIAQHPHFAALIGLPVLHWHGDTFDLPVGAAHLAATPAYVNQAFAIGRHALGLQCHPEVLAGDLERWYVGHACELAQAGLDVPRLRAEGRQYGPALEAAVRPFWGAWIRAAFA
ncbi:MAG: glutamine amidotransferase [Rhodocyclaceae bacterium]